MKLQTSGVLGTSYAIAKLAPKRETLLEETINYKTKEKTYEIYIPQRYREHK